MKSFDIDEYNYRECEVHNHGFYLGEQSKQAEVDELQKRIDDIVKWVECNKASIPLSEWHGYTTEEYVDADDLLDILKGDQS